VGDSIAKKILRRPLQNVSAHSDQRGISRASAMTISLWI
jgi:hypothetical protein